MLNSLVIMPYQKACDVMRTWQYQGVALLVTQACSFQSAADSQESIVIDHWAKFEQRACLRQHFRVVEAAEFLFINFTLNIFNDHELCSV